jgi:hypothetical protein
MKYYLLIIFLIAIVIAAGCTNSKSSGPANDDAFVEFYQSSQLTENTNNFMRDLVFRDMEKARIDARVLAQDYKNSPIPNDPELFRAREGFIAGYTQVAQGVTQGDINGGAIELMTPRRTMENWIDEHKK